MRTRFGDSKEEHGKVRQKYECSRYIVKSVQCDIIYYSILLGWDCKIT